MKIAVASGKGGTGKTFVSVNLFKMMELSGFDVTLADCDVEVPNCSVFIRKKFQNEWTTEIFHPEIERDKCIFCGACAEYCNYNAITCVAASEFITLSEELCHSCGACLYACRRGAIIPALKRVGKVASYGDGKKNNFLEGRMEEGQNSSVPVIGEAIRHGEENHSRYMILDAPPGCTCPFVHVATSSDLILLVTEPTPFGLSDLKHTIDVLRQMRKSFCVIINRADLGFSQMKEYLEGEKIQILAEIPYSEEIAKHYAKGELAVGRMPEMTELFRNLMKKIVEYESCDS